MSELLVKIKRDYPQLDSALIERAYYFAQKAHEGQKRESGEPYFTHPCAVATILLELGMDAETITAALLHDVLEDTDVSHDELGQEFGESIALLVDGIIGGVGGAHFFVHVSTKVAGGLKDKDEFVKKVDKFTFGGFTALSAASMRTAAAMDLLGIDYQFVSGFGGDGPLQAALQLQLFECLPERGTGNPEARGQVTLVGQDLPDGEL